MRVWRKQRPVYSGVLAYFPDALLEVAHVSFLGNEQHNPGEPLHWAKEKSTDEPDALVRHLIDRARGEVRDTEGARHLAKAAWRALANLQREIDAEKAAVKLSPIPECEEPPLRYAPGYHPAEFETARPMIDPSRCPKDGEPNCCPNNANRTESACARAARYIPDSYLNTGIVTWKGPEQS